MKTRIEYSQMPEALMPVIFNFLDNNTLAKVARVCKGWYFIAAGEDKTYKNRLLTLRARAYIEQTLSKFDLTTESVVLIEHPIYIAQQMHLNLQKHRPLARLMDTAGALTTYNTCQRIFTRFYDQWSERYSGTTTIAFGVITALGFFKWYQTPLIQAITDNIDVPITPYLKDLILQWAQYLYTMNQRLITQDFILISAAAGLITVVKHFQSLPPKYARELDNLGRERGIDPEAYLQGPNKSRPPVFTTLTIPKCHQFIQNKERPAKGTSKVINMLKSIVSRHNY